MRIILKPRKGYMWGSELPPFISLTWFLALLAASAILGSLWGLLAPGIFLLR